MALRWYLFQLISAIAPTCKESPDTMRNVDIFFTRTNAKGQTELAVKEGLAGFAESFKHQAALTCFLLTWLSRLQHAHVRASWHGAGPSMVGKHV